jgi:hypothetical protein
MCKKYTDIVDENRKLQVIFCVNVWNFFISYACAWNCHVLNKLMPCKVCSMKQKR